MLTSYSSGLDAYKYSECACLFFVAAPFTPDNIIRREAKLFAAFSSLQALSAKAGAGLGVHRMISWRL
jgi:hypothetical protein